MDELQEAPTDNHDELSSDDENEDDIYDKFTDEDFKSEKNIKELIEYVEKYIDHYTRPMIDYLSQIHYRLFVLESNPFTDNYIIMDKLCIDTMYNNYRNVTKIEEPAKFKCILRFIDFVIKNKNDFKDEYKIIDNLTTHLYTMKHFGKKFNDKCNNTKLDSEKKYYHCVVLRYLLIYYLIII